VNLFEFTAIAFGLAAILAIPGVIIGELERRSLREPITRPLVRNRRV
jgi:hypothetical protein